MRRLKGPVRPTGGTARVLGEAAGSSEALRRTGAAIEAPDFYPYLLGRATWRVILER